MQTKLHTAARHLASHARRVTLSALTAGAMLTAGCASAAVTGISQTSPANLPEPLRADVIYVHAFDADAQQVKVDSGFAHKLKALASGGSAMDAQSKAAAQASEEVAGEIVRQLRAKGLPAVRSDAPPPANVNALVIEGDLRQIDEGNSRRRMLIGLGAGKSEVSAVVRVSYQPANGATVPVQRFTAGADSGHMPGVAETGGIGAAAGHLATAAGAGVGMHGATEVRRDSVQGDAERLGRAIAKAVEAGANGKASGQPA